jgi:hypothetical protein
MKPNIDESVEAFQRGWIDSKSFIEITRICGGIRAMLTKFAEGIDQPNYEGADKRLLHLLGERGTDSAVSFAELHKVLKALRSPVEQENPLMQDIGPCDRCSITRHLVRVRTDSGALVDLCAECVPLRDKAEGINELLSECRNQRDNLEKQLAAAKETILQQEIRIRLPELFVKRVQDQIMGELCPLCGWAMKFPGEPCRCEIVKHLAAAKVEITRLKRPVPEQEVSHCADCCCARSWKALGIDTENTRLSIPEHIDKLRADLAAAKTEIERASLREARLHKIIIEENDAKNTAVACAEKELQRVEALRLAVSGHSRECTVCRQAIADDDAARKET